MLRLRCYKQIISGITNIQSEGKGQMNVLYMASDPLLTYRYVNLDEFDNKTSEPVQIP